MKKALLTLLIGFLFYSGFSQQTYQYRYHIFDNYLLNPAYVGNGNYYTLQTGYDQRFYGLSNSSPRTSFLTAHSRLGKGYMFAKDGKINKFFGQFGNVALGFQFLQYNYGPQLETNIGLTYGYHLNLGTNNTTKLPRKIVFAFTPRLQRIGFNVNKLNLTGIDGLAIDNHDENYIDLASIDKISSWFFTSDLGAVYQTAHVDVGVAGLSIIPYKNRLETDSLYMPDNNNMYTYDSLYPAKFMADFKVKFLRIHDSRDLDIDFIPSFSALYAPKTNHAEFFLDLKLDAFFKNHIAGIRSEIIFNGQLGLNVHYLKGYSEKHLNMLNPYVVFDFKNYAITYMHSFYLSNDLVKAPGISGGSRIAILLKIGNDRIVRKTSQSNPFKR
ncbi:MAG: type IX secretion system membrane protein PorP/SprF [Prolixibacteraceae bacterium]|jgi:hypothetical protein|nr:type IX secretion system membrane protein PorP/SprF [Prolixibacteraceae bacterium]